MGRKDKTPVTSAIRVLKQAGVSYEECLYDYVEHGGTTVSAEALGVDEHAVVKTLVMEDDARQPLIVLMHGDRSVSTKNLARAIGAKLVQPCDPVVAEKHSGYRVGGTSPFGTRKRMPIYVQESILALDRIYINGGHRGFLVGISPDDLVRVLQPVAVDVAN
jgi:Cys-tRNA(Pro) deacylase